MSAMVWAVSRPAWCTTSAHRPLCLGNSRPREKSSHALLPLPSPFMGPGGKVSSKLAAAQEQSGPQVPLCNSCPTQGGLGRGASGVRNPAPALSTARRAACPKGALFLVGPGGRGVLPGLEVLVDRSNLSPSRSVGPGWHGSEHQSWDSGPCLASFSVGKKKKKKKMPERRGGHRARPRTCG